MYTYMLAKNNDYSIYVNLISSPAGRYLSRRPHVIALIQELLSQHKQLRGPRVVIERNMGRDIGTTDVVPTSDKDTIYYAQPLKSVAYVRFAKNRLPQTSTMLTIVAVQDTEGNYEVTDAWVGDNYPAFPGEERATAESTPYWQTHAFVQDARTVQSKSITKAWPY